MDSSSPRISDSQTTVDSDVTEKRLAETMSSEGQPMIVKHPLVKEEDILRLLLKPSDSVEADLFRFRESRSSADVAGSSTDLEGLSYALLLSP